MDAPINPNDPRPDPGSGRGTGASSTRSSPYPGRSDPFDTLADLFLGPPVRVEATSPAPLRLVGDNPSITPPEGTAPREIPRAPHRPAPMPMPPQQDGLALDSSTRGGVAIEGLVLGHLPIFASAWATQYAKHVAETSRVPVAFLRFTGDRASLDLYLPGPLSEPIPTGAATLAEAIVVASARAPRWIVRLPDACEPDLADGAVDVLTLLTGADEAAVVACYRTLKSLSAGTTDRDSDEIAGPDLWRVAVMGSDPVKAGQAGTKVRRAAEAFLEASLDISACVARIGVLKSAQLFDGTATMPWRDALRLVRSTPQTAPPPHTPTPPDGRSGPKPGPASSPAPAPRIEVRPIANDPSRLEARSIPPASQSASKPPVETPAIPGLRPSAARCPACPAIELASDAAGRLHLIAAVDSPDAVAALLAVSAWAKEHAALLSLADRALVNLTDPTLHCLTTEPAGVRRLLDTSIRVHAVVRVGSQTALVDLN